MFLTILISVVISSFVTIVITLLAAKVSTNVFVSYLAATEDRFDKKLGLKRQLQKHHFSK